MNYVSHFTWRYGWYYYNQKSLVNSGVSIDRVGETVKHKIKWLESGFFGCYYWL